MGKYFQDSETVRVSFPDGEFIDIKEEFSQDDMDFVMGQMVQGQAVPDDEKKTKTVISMKFGKAATLERAIVAWSFKDAGGGAIPVTPENINRLRAKYRAQVLTEIDRLSREAEAFAKN